MEFTAEHILRAPLDKVLTMYSDPAYAPRKYQELGLRDIEVVRTSKDASRFQIAVRYKRKASIEVPKMAQKFVGGSEWLQAQQTDTWDLKARTGRLDVVIDAFKGFATIRCDMKLDAHPEGAINRMRWTVECAVPLIGGTLAKFLAQDLQRKTEEDGALANRLLAGY